MNGATETLAKFAATTKFEEIPSFAVSAAKLAILDSFGVMLAGSRDTACRVLSNWVKEQNAPPHATVTGQGFRSSALLASLANGHAAHALDLDDSGHFSTHTLPATIALGEQTRISGAKILQAYILGREVCSRLDATFDGHRAQGQGPTHRGWHHTGTNGSLGAAVSAGVVLDLNVPQMKSALGTAANSASGLRANMGSMAKALVCGNAAHNGVMAATLAQRGFTSEESILEVPQGFANAFCIESEIDWKALTHDLGKRYEIETGLVIKDYPCCTPAHRPIEALLQIVQKHDIRPEEVVSIECDPHAFSLRRHDPKDAQEGQYSLEFCLSVSLLDRKMGVEQMTDERVRAPDVQALMHHIKFVPPENPISISTKERLTVYLQDGRILSAEVLHPRRITSDEDIEAKFFTCALRAIPKEVAIRLRDSILNLEGLADIISLMEDARGQSC